MEPWIDELADDLLSISFTSAGTTVNRSTSSGSRSSSSAAALTPAQSAHSSFSSSKLPPSLRSSLSLTDLRFRLRLGSGDIGSVFLAEFKSAVTVETAGKLPILAAKVMDKKELVSRSKEGRAKTEREILESLDHPFLPTLYAAIDSPKWLCLLTEFCPGGDLHVLRQKQTYKRFHESAVRFYVSEVIVAIEYLHMLGIVYRDLKPENVLVRSDGHIMLTDFDLSLKCDESTSTPQIVLNRNNPPKGSSDKNESQAMDHHQTTSSCMIPNCIVPAVSCFHPRIRRRKKKTDHRNNGPELVAEPVDARSMSFVGTHEYLAPEIVSGYRCFVDGSWKETDIFAGYGWYCISSDSATTMGAANRRRILSPLHAELEALLCAMRCMLGAGYSHVAFFTDCSDLVKMVSSPTEWPAFAVYLEDIAIDREEFLSFSLSYVKRSENVIADKLARNVRVLPHCVTHVNHIPPNWLS